ncbi:MAG: hypothetical protein K8L99_19840 [Anaerolineae bacterium]|nr:hypothetical protein [Anaerolineae bacterium]
MANVLEREIIEKFRLLKPEDRVRVLYTLQEELAADQLNLSDWLQQVDTVQITLRPDESGDAPFASELVNEAREERDADILRSIGFRDSTGDRVQSPYCL